MARFKERTMWIGKAAQIERSRKKIARMSGPIPFWKKGPCPYGPPIHVNPFTFLLAASRCSVLGTYTNKHDQFGGVGLGLAVLHYLTVTRSSTPPFAPRLQLNAKCNPFKDFVKSTITGTIGAAVAYVDMQSSGYGWVGHWEDCSKKSGNAGSAPDFVFSSATETCLVEAKGSSRKSTNLDNLAQDSWSRQVWPHRTTPLKLGGTATEGRVIATHISESHPGATTSAYGRFKPGGAAHQLGGRTSVLLSSYLDITRLLGLRSTNRELRRRFWEKEQETSAHDSVLTKISIDSGELVETSSESIAFAIDSTIWEMSFFVRTSTIKFLSAAFLGETIDRETTPPAHAGNLMFGVTKDGISLSDQSIGEAGRVFTEGKDGFGALFVRK
jgi:hypothetical protein